MRENRTIMAKSQPTMGSLRATLSRAGVILGLMLFLAITVGASFLIKRPLWEKLFVAASALVIAVLTNILRITVTAFLHEYVGAALADKVFHDLAGWLMMPVATGLLFLELYLLSKLLIEPSASRPSVLAQRNFRR
mgnify:CR=1 FL=1